MFFASGLTAVLVSCGDASGPSDGPATISANIATTQTGVTGLPVAVPPSVTVRDRNGVPLEGETVSFAVTSGGGSVTGETARTNSEGIATVGSWTLGTEVGINTLDATVASLPPMTFTANGVTPCGLKPNYALGATVSGVLTISDCRVPEGYYVDFVSTTVTHTDGPTLLFTLTASGFDALIVIFSADMTPIGTMGESFPTGPTAALKVMVPPGNFVLGLSGAQTNITGSYTITSSASAPTVTNCERVFVARGVTASQALETTDCAFSRGFVADKYNLYVVAGQPVTITMSSSAVDSYLEVYDNSGNLVSSNNDRAPGTKDAAVGFIPARSEFLTIYASSYVSGQTGAYTLKVQ